MKTKTDFNLNSVKPMDLALMAIMCVRYSIHSVDYIPHALSIKIDLPPNILATQLEEVRQMFYSRSAVPSNMPTDWFYRAVQSDPDNFSKLLPIWKEVWKYLLKQKEITEFCDNSLRIIIKDKVLTIIQNSPYEIIDILQATLGNVRFIAHFTSAQWHLLDKGVCIHQCSNSIGIINHLEKEEPNDKD